jgi:hypothetical protein
MGVPAQERSIQQRTAPDGSEPSGMEGSQGPVVPREVKNWRLTDDFTRADSIVVDTVSSGFQIYNPIYKRSIANVYLGNLGNPGHSVLVQDVPVRSEFLFANNLSYWFTSPDEWNYYNTRTPYTNLYYQYAGPKSRSEEQIGVLFTQNVFKDWNIGMNYKLISSIGQYAGQRAENRHFRFFSSFSGPKYAIHGSFVYNKTDQYEGGGIEDDDYILSPQKYDFGQTENIPVIFADASTRIDNYKLFINQKLGLGNINLKNREGDATPLPVATLFHTFELDRYSRVYQVDDLSDYFPDGETPLFYDNMLIDSIETRDSVFHTSIKNTFQIKFNEEANSLFRFGLRVYLTNQIENTRYPAAPLVTDETESSTIYQSSSENRSATAIGGQLFKNLGENFFWNGGLKIWFQGYKTGDSEITGSLNSRFRIKKDTAGLFANGGIFLSSPSFFEEEYYSNHFEWSHNFSPVKTVKARGGITIPTRRMEFSGEVRLINDYIFWNQEALPEQSNEFIKLIQLRLDKHFVLGGFHSRNQATYQITSHDDIIPLPQVALFSSNYYQNTMFKVLFFQLGFDIRYHSAYYSPDYMPATGQFFIQRERKTGNYPMVDVFTNFHLKRANIFVKLDHANQGIPNYDYFHTIGYPANPRGIRFGVSWNFYD